MEFGGKWCSQVRAAQGTPVLMLTWGRKDASSVPDPQEQKALLATYLNLARKEKAAVAPVGIAWENCLRRHPGIALYQADGQHPTEAGSYLAACVMYCTLFGKSPLGLPAKLSLKGVRLCSLPADRAKSCKPSPGIRANSSFPLLPEAAPEPPDHRPPLCCRIAQNLLAKRAPFL